MQKRTILPIILAALPLTVAAQHLRPGQIDWGTREKEFPAALEKWAKGQKWSDDDNFFISRVRPKQRFRNTATQVNPSLSESNDKNLIFWVPINNYDNNALPDGVFDSEVFPMWSYITHYGNWSTTLIRMPGNFADVAHRNGVPVSVVASVPWGDISPEWEESLQRLADAGADKVADYLTYYGVDGIGYNSEFNTQSETLIPSLQNFHTALLEKLKESGRSPLAELIWYDGTNNDGRIAFDRGLGSHNADNWGYGDTPRTSLFFNYNWNNEELLDITVSNADTLGRTPLDIYAAINMQGREPHNDNPEIWTLLKKYPLSIGLWGAHSQNMFFESRAEKGTTPDARQRSYMLRMERWFTGGSRNPLNSPEVNNSIICTADNTGFFGMSKFMSARSALKWDLSEEPFITHFNLGNGKFFNYAGRRCHNSEWYNIGIQDYLPTWQWWFADKFLGREAGDVPAQGLDAQFVWDDAWMGGSLMRVFGSADDEYLHLFKTEFPLQKGDVITVRYKNLGGSADISLALSAKGEEEKPVAESSFTLMKKGKPSEPGEWVERRFTVGKNLAGKDLAMVALHFKNADNLDLRLGEFSIVRGDATSARPEKPEVERAQILGARHDGADGKIIFNMPNDKGDDVCYNSDVNTSYFKLYARQKGQEPVLMGMTTSWAGLLFSIPYSLEGAQELALGVSALSLDMTAESEIAWSDYMPLEEHYTLDDGFSLSAGVLNPNRPFSIRYDDPRHEPGDWSLVDCEGKEVASARDAMGLELPQGLADAGNYCLRLTGYVADAEGQRVKGTREYPAYVQVVGARDGAAPEITSLTANGKPDGEALKSAGATVELAFTAEGGDADVSRGIRVGENAVGFNFHQAPFAPRKPFSISFWLRPDDFKNNSNHLFSIRDKTDAWAVNNWGYFWHSVNEDGTTSAFTLRMNKGGNAIYHFDNTRITPGVWHHFAYVFDINLNGEVRPQFYLDGVRQQVTKRVRGEETLDPAVDGELPYELYPFAWRRDNVAAIGGYVHQGGSVNGNVDNLVYWRKVLTGDDVKYAMGNPDLNALPEDVAGWFDFEEAPEADGSFISKGSGTFPAGSHDYRATEVEGQGQFYWTEPEYCAGAPSLKGSAYRLTPKVEWITDGAEILEQSGDASEGKATLRFDREGEYKVGVKVSSDHGEDVRMLRIVVGPDGWETVGIETVGSDVEGPEMEGSEDTEKTGEDFAQMSAKPSPFDSYIDVEAPADGRYRVSLSDMQGRRLLSNDFDAITGEPMRIYPAVESGLYLLSLETQGRLYAARRLLRR